MRSAAIDKAAVLGGTLFPDLETTATLYAAEVKRSATLVPILGPAPRTIATRDAI